METIQAQVHKRLLEKADRLFTGTIGGRIIELLQNACRAGATRVDITNDDGQVTVRDNGTGIEDFSKLLQLGDSGWDTSLEHSEDPAGVGVFCLSPRTVTIKSKNRSVTIGDDGWRGTDIPIRTENSPIDGTEISFTDETWTRQIVEPHAVFSSLKVSVDGQECEQMPFLSNNASLHPELGCRIAVLQYRDLGTWHNRWRHQHGFGNVLVNFHGQVVTFTHHPAGSRDICFLVDMTDEPTDIRLMLPARTRLVENDAYTQLLAVLEREFYEYYRCLGTHQLYYREYLRARELGIDLPEAQPSFRVGLLEGDTPEPIEVDKPDEVPLAECFRLHPGLYDIDTEHAANAHLLAAIGLCPVPFVPVSIDSAYDGYRWANLPTIDKVQVDTGAVLKEYAFGCGSLVCTDSLRITAHTSNGKVFSSEVCMAILPPLKKHWLEEHRVFVTLEARDKLDAADIWYHLGGWYEDGDTYDTQLMQFSEALDEFWAMVLGPDEPIRSRLVTAAQSIDTKWRSVTIAANGTVTIAYAGGKKKLIKPLGTRP